MTLKLKIKAYICVILSIMMIFGRGIVMPTQTKAAALTGKTATEIVNMIGSGWNLGNSLDATGASGDGHETSWGNPKIVEQVIEGAKAAGFNAIRIPTSWFRELSNDGKYTINQNFMKRVKEVVNFAYSRGMFVILNIHHEEWVNDRNIENNYERIGKQLKAVWTQIADEFAGYDQHLIFEGMNEPRKVGTGEEWTGNAKAYEAVNYLNQIFVETVRASGKGYNSERCLMIPGYAASSMYSVLSAIKIPQINGKNATNIIISAHCYEPYNFCLQDTWKDFDPNDKKYTSELDTRFYNLQYLFLSKGIPVIMGETGATNSGNNTAAREKWAAYVGKQSAAYGIPVFLWDNGSKNSGGGECHSYIDRYNGNQVSPTIIKALFDGYKSVKNGGSITEKDTTAKVDSLLSGTVIWSSKNGKASTNQWDSSYIQISSRAGWYIKGGKIAVVYTGSGQPKLILDSEAKSAWWIPVNPNSIEKLGDKKVAYFTYDNLMKEMKNNGVTDPGQLRNLMVIATDGNITTYEINAMGTQEKQTTVKQTTTAKQTTSAKQTTTEEQITTVEQITTEERTATEQEITNNLVTSEKESITDANELISDNRSETSLEKSSEVSIKKDGSNSNNWLWYWIAGAVTILIGIVIGISFGIIYTKHKKDKNEEGKFIR